MNADSGQGELFRSYLVSAPAAYAMAFGSLAAFTLGAWQGSVAVMLGGPALIVLAVVAIAWICADRAAANDFYFRFASSWGWAMPAGRTCSRSRRSSVPATGVMPSSGCTAGFQGG